MKRFAKRGIPRSFGILLPKPSRLQNCALCGFPAIQAGGLCGECAAKLPEQPKERWIPGIDKALAAFGYLPPVAGLIHRFKYENARYLAELFARHMAAADDFSPQAVFAPVPLHPRRQKQRGFSQTAELCKELARQTGRQVEETLLIRNRDTPPQTGLDFAERQTNLAGAFTAAGAAGVQVILVDDVITSGATLRECAKTLRLAGASSVFALCTASVDVEREGDVGGAASKPPLEATALRTHH